MDTHDSTGNLEDALGRLHASGPERLGRLTNHAPMVVEALAAHGRADDVTDPDTARDRLTGLVRAATHRHATHGHGEATMLVHAATAPNAVLRTLGSLPRALRAPSLRAAWTASAAVTAMYPTAEPVADVPAPRCTAQEVLERALAHGDKHVVKLTDTARDVGDERALAAALRAVELSDPLVPN
ncbi:hypothetical protein AB0E85_37385 [Streptomyces sp. NPDC029044]|uniref:hypothetical protein n=1 Tax=Streptomyces sp. NPDC029044 TaxID=3157198 RepID=UPI0033D69CA6